MSLINWKLELKLRWTKQCVLPVLGNKNDDTNAISYVLSAIKDTKLYIPVITLSVTQSKSIKTS